MAQTKQIRRTWKQVSLIDNGGFVVPDHKEGCFTHNQVITLLQDLLHIKQSHGLPINYLNYTIRDSNTEKISYQSFMRLNCKKCYLDSQKVIDKLFIMYKLVRLPKQSSSRPFLLLFNYSCNNRVCSKCGEDMTVKVFQNGFFAIRSRFVSFVQSKVKFMQRYPAYIFQPFNHDQPSNYGQVLFQYVKQANNHKKTFYFEKSEEILVNALKAQAIRRGIDCQIARKIQWDDKIKIILAKKMYKDYQRLKYICGWRGRNKPMYTWTRFNCIKIYLYFCKLETTYDTSTLRQDIELKVPIQNIADADTILSSVSNFDMETRYRRMLNRSIQAQVQSYQRYAPCIQKIKRWHKDLSSYKYPYIVLISMQIPQQICPDCDKVKQGLAFLTYLKEYLYDYLYDEVFQTIKNFEQP